MSFLICEKNAIEFFLSCMLSIWHTKFINYLLSRSRHVCGQECAISAMEVLTSSSTTIQRGKFSFRIILCSHPLPLIDCARFGDTWGKLNL
jgi:hypothetical protein